MKYIIILLMLCLSNLIFAQKIVNGIVQIEPGSPLPGVSVLVPGTQSETSTDIDGKFSITIPEGFNTLKFTYIGFSTQYVEINSDFLTVSLTPLDADDIGEEVVVTASGSSPVSFWYGAEASYNFVGDGNIENFVGSAPIQIGDFNIISDKFILYLTGNISNIASEISVDTEKNINALVQGSRGVSIALTPTYIIKKGTLANDAYQLYTYANVGFKYMSLNEGTNDEQLNFSQSIFNAGIEFEGLSLNNDSQAKKPVQLFIGLFQTGFNEGLYEQLTGERKRKLSGANMGITVPIPGLPLGFRASTIFMKDQKPIWTIGLMIRNK
ncbi:carboxypeptidase-like regulatory domain-containing protein [Roseivirga sp.]|uniref:carboxypeptidase-like regulatory domain-containing protein n=1 Tax=Roseivirga sp. TaxID=1964215 RepID=UPI002B279D70|nr:carboxypeptidase-like regulatory domain-containing protein [Roseivirga sp.]